MEVRLRAERRGRLHSVRPRDGDDGGDRGGTAAALCRHDASEGQPASHHAAALLHPRSSLAWRSPRLCLSHAIHSGHLLPLFESVTWPISRPSGAGTGHQAGSHRHRRAYAQDVAVRGRPMQSLSVNERPARRSLISRGLCTIGRTICRRCRAFSRLSRADRSQPAGTRTDHARWACPRRSLRGRAQFPDPGPTNLRNFASRRRRFWPGAENCCVVPFTSFSENQALADELSRRSPPGSSTAGCAYVPRNCRC